MVLEGVVVSRDVIRLTPGGIETLNLTLQHQSHQLEGTHQVAVELEMNAIAFGEVAKTLNALKTGATLSVKGFLSQKNRYSTMPTLHITQFKMLNES